MNFIIYKLIKFCIIILMESFYFNGFKVDNKEQCIAFDYAFLYQNKKYNFVEKLYLPTNLFQNINNINDKLISNILFNISLILGISYWKTRCFKKVIIKGYTLNKEQADFWNQIYNDGLGEFFFINKLDTSHYIKFPYKNNVKHKKDDDVILNKILLPIGGGKDSITSAYLLEKCNFDFDVISLNPVDLDKNVIKIINKNAIFIKRVIDPKLLKLNKDKNIYNGHVPFSAILAFIFNLIAILGEYKYIIVSNEDSANYGNTKYCGKNINHQWSKTYDFENQFVQYIKKYIHKDLTYFSLLRPLNEVYITKIFSNLKKYHPYFSSCNGNFKIHNDDLNKHWCLDCPKCVFVFIMLSAFLSEKELLSIFKQNLYHRRDLLHMFISLLGIDGIKPFECVGTVLDTRYAFCKAKKNYKNTFIMQMLKDDKVVQDCDKNMFTIKNKHNIPSKFKIIIDEIKKFRKV